MFDIGMTELLVIGIVALIVVGPKDLPGMFRALGRFTGKMKGMAREFQRAMDDAADESGVRDVAKDLKGMSNPRRMGLDKLNDAADRFEKWEPGKPAQASGPETQKLREERAAEAEKNRDSAAKRAEARQAGGTEEPAGQAASEDEPHTKAPAKQTGTAADSPLTRDGDA